MVAENLATVGDVIAGEAANALRDIATIIGCPANADPLTDLDGLVMAVRGLAERVVGVEARIADAVAVDRMTVGAWIRACVPEGGGYARCIEHGDHIDGAPPLPSLRMVMLVRDELLRQVETLTARVLELEAPASPERADLLARVGADVLAEVER